MTLTRTKFLVLAGGTLALLLIATGIVALKSGPADERREVFEQAWRIIDEKFYDRTMNGLDWPAVRKTYLRRLKDARNSNDLYEKVLSPMLALLESSHVQAISPATVSLHNLSETPHASELPRGRVSCSGIMMVFPTRSISARVKSLQKDSFLYKQGVRESWRVHGWSGDAKGQENFFLKFLSTAGEPIQLPVKSADPMLPDLGAIKEDYKSLGGLLAARADPSTELNMKALGMVVVIGQNASLPVVVDVINGSEAERAGVEPGSTIMRYVKGDSLDGYYTVDAEFVSPSGVTYSAKYKYPACDPSDREAKLLPGNILLLRFNSFEDGTIPWLDEQLRAGPNAIVLDLRLNRGGLATVLLQVMGRFMEEGTKIRTDIRSDRAEVFTATAAPNRFTGPVAVLTTRASTSAAEVVAGAFQAYGRAKVYGQTTRGDVLLGNRFSLPDGGMVSVPVADALTPDGKRLENVGVKPDVEVMPTLETVRAGRDVVLEAALADLVQDTH